MAWARKTKKVVLGYIIREVEDTDNNIKGITIQSPNDDYRFYFVWATTKGDWWKPSGTPKEERGKFLWFQRKVIEHDTLRSTLYIARYSFSLITKG